MSESSSTQKRNKLIKIYGFGILAFTAIFGFITALDIFLANMNLT